MTRRIVVTGPESTGKTTLARDLARSLHTIWVPEYARDYAASRSELTAADVEPIGRGQAAREDAILSEQPSLADVVLDTDLLSTTVYAEHYYGSCPRWVWTEAQRRLGALYLLCDVDLAWVADGVRDQPEARTELHQCFGRRLQEFGARVLPVAGVGPVRLQVALAAVRGWRAAQPRLHGSDGGDPQGRLAAVISPKRFVP
ncbi:MAG: ATP-binding protein [Gemmatimonadaceae bacterium]|nr:ATP-binding protein [Gemmatimonadaceae bacterium]